MPNYVENTPSPNLNFINGIENSLKQVKRLSDDVAREATSGEVAELKKENARLKETVADLVLRYDIVKKVWIF